MRINYKLIIGIILVTLILSEGIVCSQGNLYSDPQGRFSFNLPVGWKSAVPYDSSQAAYFTYSVTQGTVGELIIMIEQLPFSASVDQYATAAEENGFKQLPSYKSGTQLPASVSGLPAIKKSFTFSPQVGLTLQAEAYLLVSGNFAYTILLDVLPDYFTQLQPGFTQAVMSFQIQSGAPVAIQPTPQPAPIAQPGPSVSTPAPTSEVPCPPTETTTTPPTTTATVPVLPTIPTQTPVASGANMYSDPQGRFSIPIPPGSTTAQTTEIGVVLNTPDGAGIVAMYTLGEQYVQGMVNQIKPDHQFHGQSQLPAGNRSALVELYSKVNPQDNINYATLVTTYPGTSFMIIITLPAEKYNQAQTWITEMIKGAYIK